MLVRQCYRSVGFKCALVTLSMLIFLAGLGTKLSKYRANHNDKVLRVRLCAEKGPEPAATVIDTSGLSATVETVSLRVSALWMRATAHTGTRPDPVEPAVCESPSYDPHLPNIAYRPPPSLG
ncbi:MAG TPA: hypothetical protein VN612_00780 [Acidobacteriaceae bacterium]|nr:hypothetical protein [Acidobacteriaceae bacterium]